MDISFNQFCKGRNISNIKGFWEFVLKDHYDRDNNVIWYAQPEDKNVSVCPEEKYEMILEQFICSCPCSNDIEPYSQEQIDGILTEIANPD